MTDAQRKKRAKEIDRADSLMLSSAVISTGVGQMLNSAQQVEPTSSRLLGLAAMLMMAAGMRTEADKTYSRNTMAKRSRGIRE